LFSKDFINFHQKNKMKLLSFAALVICLIFYACSGQEPNYSNRGTKQVSVTIGIPIDLFLATYFISTKSTKYTQIMQDYQRTTKSTFNIAKFVEIFEKGFPDEAIVKLLNLHKSPGLKISFSNNQVQEYLEKESEKTLLAIQKIIEHRISRMTSGVPSFVVDAKKGQIVAQINDIKNVEAVIHAIQANVKLEFYETFSLNEIGGNIDLVLNECDALLNNQLDSNSQLTNIQSIRSMIKPDGYSIGNVAAMNQLKVMNLLNHPKVKELLPEELEFMWGMFPHEDKSFKGLHSLYLIKHGNYERISSEDIEEATTGLTENGLYSINIRMKDEAIERWANMTGNNIGRCIAMTLDNKVLSAPMVNGQISGGSTEISGGFKMNEAKELTAMINAGSYQIPIFIVSVK